VRGFARGEPGPYSNPYVTGVGLGLVLLTAFVVVGRGLGASGAFTSSAAGVTAAIAPARAAASPLFARYLGESGSPWLDWLVFEIIGVAIGGFASAWLARRITFAVERGPRVGRTSRLAAAFIGGGVMGLGAVLARGCTSGQALTGGALLSVGSWAFILGTFTSAYAAAPLLRRLWT
jgi:uncharacterized protein